MPKEQVLQQSFEFSGEDWMTELGESCRSQAVRVSLSLSLSLDTDQTTPTPSPDVQQTRASPDLNESGKGKPSTKGQDVTDRRLAPR